MKLLKEYYGESDELRTFIYQLQKRFNPYYVVYIKYPHRTQNMYFAYEDAAKEAYEKTLKDAKANKVVYDGAEIGWTKVTLQYDEDEQEYEYIFDEEEE